MRHNDAIPPAQATRSRQHILLCNPAAHQIDKNGNTSPVAIQPIYLDKGLDECHTFNGAITTAPGWMGHVQWQAQIGHQMGEEGMVAQ